MYPTEACYPWMFRSTTDESNLEVLLDVRRGVEDLKELSATFRMSEVTDYATPAVPEEIMWLVGSWRVPEEYDSKKAMRYVNPNYVHRDSYGDISVECDCGAKIYRESPEHARDDGHEHTDDCTAEMRREAQERLNEARRKWLHRAARMCFTQEEAAPRMSLSTKSVWVYCNRSEIKWDDWRKAGRKRAIRTWVKLHDEYGYTWREIAEGFDVSPSYMRSVSRGHGRNIRL